MVEGEYTNPADEELNPDQRDLAKRLTEGTKRILLGDFAIDFNEPEPVEDHVDDPVDNRRPNNHHRHGIFRSIDRRYVVALDYMYDDRKYTDETTPDYSFSIHFFDTEKGDYYQTPEVGQNVEPSPFFYSRYKRDTEDDPEALIITHYEPSENNTTSPPFDNEPDQPDEPLRILDPNRVPEGLLTPEAILKKVAAILQGGGEPDEDRSNAVIRINTERRRSPNISPQAVQNTIRGLNSIKPAINGMVRSASPS